MVVLDDKIFNLEVKLEDAENKTKSAALEEARKAGTALEVRVNMLKYKLEDTVQNYARVWVGLHSVDSQNLILY